MTKPRTPVRSEADVARPVVAWLREMGFEVYQEVSLGAGRGVADIVAMMNGVTWIIETKTSLSWDVLEQADNRKRWGHKVSVACPRRYKSSRYPERILGMVGVGLIYVSATMREVDEVIEPQFRRRVTCIKKYLNEEQKTYVEAGTAGGGHWSPFKETCKELLRVVKEKPGISVKDAIATMTKHHYRTNKTAAACIVQWANVGKIPGVELRQEGKKRTLHLKP